MFSSAADSINSGLNSIDGGIREHLAEHHDNYDEIIPHYLPAAHATNKVIHYAEHGKISDDWQDNMEDSLRLAMESTIGKTVNDLAKRGILDSSVTNQALYDIERNASDEVARQYHQNISTTAQLADTRWKNTESALNDMKIAYDGITSTYLNGAGQLGQIKQGQLGNINSALMNGLQVYNNQLSNFLQATQSQGQFEQQIFNNDNLKFQSTTNRY